MKRSNIDAMICKQEGITEITIEGYRELRYFHEKEKKKGRDFIEICRKGWKALMI